MFDVSRKVGALYSKMIFEDGYVHCDPHPGNVLVNKVNKVLEIPQTAHPSNVFWLNLNNNYLRLRPIGEITS